MALENVAEYCLSQDDDENNNMSATIDDDDECDLDEHEALVNQLQHQRNLLQKQLDEVDTLLSKLTSEPPKINGANTRISA